MTIFSHTSTYKLQTPNTGKFSWNFSTYIIFWNPESWAAFNILHIPVWSNLVWNNSLLILLFCLLLLKQRDLQFNDKPEMWLSGLVYSRKKSKSELKKNNWSLFKSTPLFGGENHQIIPLRVDWKEIFHPTTAKQKGWSRFDL